MLRSVFTSGLAASVAAQTVTSAASTTSEASLATITAVTSCHAHGSVQYCMHGTSEFEVLATATGTEEPPASYTGCHAHGSSELWCLTGDDGEVQLLAEGAEAATTPTPAEEPAAEEGELNCHFHAGIEHCVGEGVSEEVNCEKVDREYNKGLRIGLIFVMLATSVIAVFGPMVLTGFFRFNPESFVLVVIRQFGSGVIVSTAFVHLFTHAQLMFSNPCLGELEYEATTAAILMAGLSISFLVEYFAHRLAASRNMESGHLHSHSVMGGDKELATTPSPDGSTPASSLNEHQKNKSDALNALVLESGILFHSLLIGITLVVAGDSVFGTLFAVIVFHQMFEGIALGSVIAALKGTSWMKKALMASAFALVTPIGMAIGVGVLEHFNGNDKSTLIALGTLNALSAGILVWVGVVEMWAKDWMHGPLARAGAVKTGLGMFSLVLGMALMSLLGKWA